MKKISLLTVFLLATLTCVVAQSKHYYYKTLGLSNYSDGLYKLILVVDGQISDTRTLIKINNLKIL